MSGTHVMAALVAAISIGEADPSGMSASFPEPPPTRTLPTTSWGEGDDQRWAPPSRHDQRSWRGGYGWGAVPKKAPTLERRLPALARPSLGPVGHAPACAP